MDNIDITFQLKNSKTGVGSTWYDSCAEAIDELVKDVLEDIVDSDEFNNINNDNEKDQLRDEVSLLSIRADEYDYAEDGLKDWHMRVEEFTDSNFDESIRMKISDVEWHPYYHARVDYYINHWAEKRNCLVPENKKFKK